MTDIRLRKRHRMRQKEIAAIASRVEAATGSKVFSASDTVDKAEAPGYDAIIVDGKVMAIVLDGEPVLTVRGLLRYGASKSYVTVDMGAVKFVANGADVMGPGVVDADPSIAEGDFVWIRDERNKRPLGDRDGPWSPPPRCCRRRRERSSHRYTSLATSFGLSTRSRKRRKSPPTPTSSFYIRTT